MYFSDTVNYLIVATGLTTATSLFTLYPIESQAHLPFGQLSTTAATASIPETCVFGQ